MTVSDWLPPLIVCAMLTNLSLLAGSRMAGIIRATAAQGYLIGAVTVLNEAWGPHGWSWYGLLFGLFVTAVKGGLLPLLLGRTMERIGGQRELHPFVGYNLSVFCGMAGLLAGHWLTGKLAMPANVSDLAVSAAFMTMITGLLLVVGRSKALTQVIGYLTLENGIFLFGVSLAPHGPVWLELCILLDVFVAVFVMGIAIHNINREFDSIDVGRIDSLKD